MGVSSLPFSPHAQSLLGRKAEVSGAHRVSLQSWHFSVNGVNCVWLWQDPRRSYGSMKSAACCTTEISSRVWKWLWQNSPNGTAQRWSNPCAPLCPCRNTAGRSRPKVLGFIKSKIDQCVECLNSCRFLGVMPSYMENDGVLCTKLVCFYNRKVGSTLPSTQATVMLLDPEYGNVKAVSTDTCTNEILCHSDSLQCADHGWRGHYKHEDSGGLCHLSQGLRFQPIPVTSIWKYFWLANSIYASCSCWCVLKQRCWPS